MTEPARNVALIGATSGLGRAAADQLTKDGHNLILVGRDSERVQRLAKQLPTAVVIGADVSTIAGVDYAATQISGTVDHLDALVNNAGVMIPTRDHQRGSRAELRRPPPRAVLDDERAPSLAGSWRWPGRQRQSDGHRATLFGGGPVRIDFDDLQSDHGYDPFLAYSRTKLANLLFSYELQRRHPEPSVVALHPGMVRTDLGCHWPRIQVAAMHAMSIPARKGAQPVVSLATAPAVERGAYYNRFTATRSSAESYDHNVARRLWEVTEALRGPFGS